ncbi:MAG: hypothetical protein COV29_02720 [Candidatus Yanofskybacteria bacterium CG10_big_fil_rev_8_21_14_0_10_36_16]|uniref:DUF3048 domain-containing protein n=1 Tax=Candidatus Yanofskybacteria bacterium CG10_big_fil_rev_8_21_14_0_10_36_16 TaxID=1975096 RepID=A0A2J0Q7V8_9BACT|nr:MAG: hypothetical protein COV29_02720 [Candidatus Yanofskybacteria bacterium CG10_big_fil_rev_8_21_14_0_10_36_16]
MNRKLVLNIIIALTPIIALAVFLFVIFSSRDISILPQNNSDLEGFYSQSALAGIECDNAERRPIAVMIAMDPEARPLSGLSNADMVFEMIVAPSGITRLMAVFQCEIPKEIGSIRSSRLDFIPLVQGLDAIYIHWGGEKQALEHLNNGATDNIDALKYESTYFFRKKSVPRPHNGFISEELLSEAIEDFEYETKGSKTKYKHALEGENKGITDPPPLYGGNYEVRWKYNPNENIYLRARAGEEEIDLLTGEQVEAKNVVVMFTDYSPVDKDYIRVKTTGSGKAVIYQNGIKIEGQWSKEKSTDGLHFYDNSGADANFVSGPIWVEIVFEDEF